MEDSATQSVPKKILSTILKIFEKFFIYFFGGIFILTVLGAAGGYLTIAYFTQQLPQINTLKDYMPSVPSKIYSKDGVILANLGQENRSIVQLKDVPPTMIDAILSAEDESFYQHKGVDYFGILRASFVNLKAGKVVQGGSTITQQLAKSFLTSHERSIYRKIKDILLAQKIEKKFTKEEILFLYLNQVYLGGGYYGIKTAIKGYFGKELNEVTPAEAAVIAGLLVAPGKYSPYINPQYAKIRQTYVLGQMLKNKKISAKEYKAAIAEKTQYRLKQTEDFKAGYFTDWIVQRVVQKVGKEKFLTNGYIIKTTLEYETQKIAEKSLLKRLKELDKRQGYLGPIKTLTENEINSYEKQERQLIFKALSQYFTINAQLMKTYEVPYKEAEFQKIKKYEKNYNEKYAPFKLMAGNILKDSLQANIHTDESYEALVIGTNDELGFIYVSIGGSKAIISQKLFKWAHKRVLSDVSRYQPELTKASPTFKRGDVVLVKVIKKSTNQLAELDNQNKLKGKQPEITDALKNENFILAELDQNPKAQGALVSLSPKTGEITALVGGSDFAVSKFNRAVQALRQPGSSFKPLLYAAALERGYTPATILYDTPEALLGTNEGGLDLNWKPRNYDGEFMGPITFRKSLELSRNVTTIKIAQAIGLENIHKFMKRLGLNLKIPMDFSLSLGSFGISLLDLTSTYALFPNGGYIVDPISITSITDRHGAKLVLNEKQRQAALANTTGNSVQKIENALQDYPKIKSEFVKQIKGSHVYDSRLSYIMTRLLQGVVQRGTAFEAAHVSPYIGGKTGTTSSYNDALFVGFSSNCVTGVWTGFDDNKTLGVTETGAKAALPAWIDFMKFFLKKYPSKEFPMPPGITHVLVNPETGELAGNSGPRYTEVYIQGMSIQNQGPHSENTKKEILEDDSFYQSL